MNRFGFAVSLIATWFLAADIVLSAETAIRVLFKFDENGVFVRQLVKVEEDPFEGQDLTANPLATDFSGLTGNNVFLQWFGSRGELILTTSVTDPRVTRAPSHVEGSVIGRSVVTNGGWIAAGPAGANRIVVHMPANPGMALVGESWHLELSP